MYAKKSSKHLIASLMVLAALTLVAGCGKEENKPAGAAGTSFEELGKKADQAVADGTAKLAESKEVASKKLEESLVELDKKTQDLREQAAAASGAAKAELDKAVIDLQKRSESAHKDLELLRKAGEEKWQEVSVTVGKKLDDYEKTFNTYWKNLTGK